MKNKKQKIGLALGGGGARGGAHIGVIRALEEEGIKIDYIAGTSIGAFVGGIYAAGGLDFLEEFACKITRQKLIKYMDIRMSTKGVLSGDKVHKLLNEKLLPKKTFHGLNIPFCAIATDSLTAEELQINSGKLSDAIRSSISLPGIFHPFEKDGRYLVDGGLVNPMPVNVVRKMGADIVIAVDLNHNNINEKKEEMKVESVNLWEEIRLNYKNTGKVIKKKIDYLKKSKGPNIIEVLGNSINIMQDQITQKNLIKYPADILIRPKLDVVTIFDFHRSPEIIKQGYEATKKIMPEILKILSLNNNHE